MLMIANGDDSGCRDFYGHTHPGPMPERIAEGYAVPNFSSSDLNDDYGHIGMGPCELCGQGEGEIMDMFPYAILGAAAEPRPLQSSR